MSTARGALLVIEGCDRAGKSTQVKMLVEALNNRRIIAEARRFPDRTTPIGKVLDNFLCKTEDFPPEAAHLLFAANRWECSKDIVKALQAGTTIVVDRYAASGAAYTAANTGKCLEWCKEADRGLPCPDGVILLTVSEAFQRERSNWGQERFENRELQERVGHNFNKLKDETWETISGDQDPSTVHSQILQKVLDVIKSVKNTPINLLYHGYSCGICGSILPCIKQPCIFPANLPLNKDRIINNL
ncbi:hypothetical protein KM043_014513 [Ampulex compressa]|nr:hypothetical protein KM043_014513 [Ampulex compressa]